MYVTPCTTRNYHPSICGDLRPSLGLSIIDPKHSVEVENSGSALQYNLHWFADGK
ncbi:hypothetical protein SERLADRAFT_379035, partial [Serpula lacrymans var. lacrymans S7.9]